MAINGFDVAVNVTRWIPKIRAKGLSGVGRYYGPAGSAKVIHASEAQALSAAGINIIAVWEKRGSIEDFMQSHGGSDWAAQAMKCAEAIGQPKGTGIYFAVDFDARTKDETYIISRFNEINMAINGAYRVGVYGPGAICRRMRDLGLASLFWTGAHGWRDTRQFWATNAWHIKQDPTEDLGFPSQVDPDTIQGDPGWFRVGTVASTASVPLTTHPVLREGDIRPEVGDIQRRLAALGLRPGTADSHFGSRTTAAAKSFQTAHRMPPDGIIGPMFWAALEDAESKH